MTELNARDFKRPGTVEFVLAEAGLVTVVRSDEAETLQPAEGLSRLFAGGAAPPLEQVLPPLMDFVRGMSYDRSNLGLNGKGLRSSAAFALRDMGMTNEALANIEDTLAAGGASAQLRLDESRQMRS